MQVPKVWPLGTISEYMAKHLDYNFIWRPRIWHIFLPIFLNFRRAIWAKPIELESESGIFHLIMWNSYFQFPIITSPCCAMLGNAGKGWQRPSRGTMNPKIWPTDTICEQPLDPGWPISTVQCRMYCSDTEMRLTTEWWCSGEAGQYNSRYSNIVTLYCSSRFCTVSLHWSLAVWHSNFYWSIAL